MHRRRSDYIEESLSLIPITGICYFVFRVRAKRAQERETREKFAGRPPEF